VPVPAVRAEIKLPGSVHEAEALWYDTSRWPTWVDGLAHVERVDGEWPGVSAKVIWDSTPAGRGRVVERVVAHEPLSGQTLEVEDDQVRGRQSVWFTPEDEEVRVNLELRYEFKKRSLVMPLVDLLFVRRAMTASLRQTLTRFGVELKAARE
jgi:hypothetical protein